MNIFRLRFKNFGLSIIEFLSLIGIALVTLLSARYVLHMSLVGDDKVIYQNTVVIIFIVLFELTILFFLGKVLNKISELKMFIIFITMYFVMSVFMIINVDGTLRADQYLIYKHALLMNQGNYEGLLNGHYLSFNPVQLGFASYVRIFALITDNSKILFILNSLWTFGIYFIIWQISKLVSDSELYRKYVIIFEFAFLPTFFMILYAYGQVPGYSCMLISSYYFIKFIKKKSTVNLVLFILFFTLACILKNNFMIAGIVYVIIIVLDVLQDVKKLKMLFLIPVIIICMVYPSKLIVQYYRNVSGIAFDDGEPISSYIAMGLHWNEYETVGGGYDGYTFDNYTDSEYNTAVADKNARADIKKSIGEFVEDPSYAYNFFKYKLIGTWSEPLFGSIECGPLEFYGQYTHNIFIQSLYTDGYLYIIAEKYMNGYNIILFVLCIIFLISKLFFKQIEYNYEIMPALYFLGGFLFHLLSETQARYMSVYVVPLIFYSVFIFLNIIDKVKKMKDQKIASNGD